MLPSPMKDRRGTIGVMRAAPFLAIAGAVCFSAFPPVLIGGEWQAGAARVRITPDQPLVLSGKHQRSQPAEGTLHELWAKALALEDANGRRVVLITMDLVGIDRDLSRTVCAELRERFGLERRQIALAVSHTHNGPIVGGNLANMFFLDSTQQQLVDAYAARLQKQLVGVAGDALGRLAPCRLAWKIGRVDFAINRRNNPRSEIDVRIAKGDWRGPVDHDVPVLSVIDGEGRLKAVVFGYACHPIWLRHFPVWSGDYPGIAQSRLEQEHPEALALFWAGCAGDQNPVSRGGALERAEAQNALLGEEWKEEAIAEVEHLGSRLAGAVETVLAGKPTFLDGELGYDYREIDLPLSSVPTREQLIKDAKSSDRFFARRAQQILDQLQAGKSPRRSYPYPIQTWRIGKRLVVVALGGEAVVDYSIRLKQQFGADQTWVAAYTNDVMAYIPSRRILLEGGYEGIDSMIYYGLPAAWDPRIEERIVDNAVEQRDRLQTNTLP